MRRLLLVAFAALTSCASTAQPAGTSPEAGSSAADPVAQVRAVVDALFDGMRAGDSTAVRATIHPGARFQSVVPLRDSEGYRLTDGSAEQFIAAVGTPHDQVWDERIGEVDVRVDAGLATAWMAYRFYLGDRFSHCGVNAMQLANTDGTWRIVNLIDTRRQACE